MRALVTGSCGFIGHHLVKKLLDEGHEVIGVDNLITGDMLRYKALEKTYLLYQGSVRSYMRLAHEKADGFINDFDVVFHLAALPRVPVSFERPFDSLDNNFTSTLAALEIARKCNAVFVYSSSSSVYGTQEEFPFTEEMTIGATPESPYALSKWIGEELCTQYALAFKVPSVSLRYFNVYGPGMTKGGYATAIRTFLDARKEGKPLPVTGNGMQERDFTHVSDVVNANYLAALHLLDHRPEKHEAYNIGAGSPRSVLSVAAAIGGSIDHVAPRREPRKTHADIRKARDHFGWEPLVKFEDGIKDLIKNEL